MPDDALVVLCTCPGDSVAAEIATGLLEDRLAACVTRVPGVKSWYHWEGQIQRDDEVLLVIKSTRDRYAAVEAQIRKLHPYEVPEIIALPVAFGSAAYLDWVQESTKPA
ncbi:MAG: divalent-cation tolerance protein CutA [Gammaproteobacteria bacterium]|nr:divalent-cation tolerance protein CutA [Gammaproteobacteria bacterium]